MRYGKFIKNGSKIGIVATSFGCNGYPYEDKVRNANKILENKGYKVEFVEHINDLNLNNLLEDNYKIKANEFINMYKNDSIDVLISTAGGELMINTIENIDFNEISKYNPKFFMGYSDNTWLTFLLPTLCDIASIYGYNFSTFGSNNYHKSLNYHLDILSGKNVVQESFDKYQTIDITKTPTHQYDGFNLDTNNEWKELNNRNNFHIKGRVIGGCLEVLNQIRGTKFDKVDNFNNKYIKDGFIWYFENCEMNIIDQYRSYKSILDSSWIKNCKGILIGRTISKESIMGIEYINMLHNLFDKYNIPIIYDVDIGHLEPSFAIINGSIATINYSNKKGTIEFELI